MVQHTFVYLLDKLTILTRVYNNTFLLLYTLAGSNNIQQGTQCELKCMDSSVDQSGYVWELTNSL